MFQGIERESVEGLISRYGRLTCEQVAMACERKEEDCIVSTVSAGNGETIPVLEMNSHIWYLNSIYNPTQAALDWAMQYDTPEINDYSIFMVFGLGDGRAILELLKVKPNCLVIIYEPSLEVFRSMMGREEVARLLNSERVCAVVEGICDEYFFHVLQQILNYSNYQLVIQAVLPNYDRIFNDSYKKMLDDYLSIAELIVFTRNTEIIRGIEIARNSYALTADIIKQYSVTQLIGTVQRKQIEDIPAILVAAGPSLDKNVNDLKLAEGKAFLMVVDTALNTVLEHGIMPDMTISIDSRKPLTLFKNELAEQIPIAVSPHSNQEVVKRNHSRHYYEIDQESYLNRVFAGVTGKQGEQLPTGGSVANNALSLLIEMGFQTIILVGQDLAYPGGREHTRAAYNSKDDEVSFDKKEYIEVEDIYGNMVLTESNMNLYRKWIEGMVAGYSEIRVIDATEGGAKIAGTEIRTLESCVEEFCKREIDRNLFFADDIPFFTEDEQNNLKKEIQNVSERVRELEDIVKEENVLYDRLEQVKPEEQPDELKNLLNEISVLNEKIEEIDISVAIRPYIAEQAYQVEGEMFQYGEADSVESQIKDFARLGKKLMNGYMEGIEKFREDIPMMQSNF